MARTHRNKKWYTAADEMTMRPSCGSCGADVGESTVFVWHYANEDCRGIKDPIPYYAGRAPEFFQQHQKRHARAVQDPQPGFERALLNMIRGFLEYAETHAGTLNNHVLGEALKRTGLKSLYEI